MGELSFHMADVYPNMGFIDTTTKTVAEADDQHALVDNQQLAQDFQVTTSPAEHKTIWFAVAGVVLAVILLGGFSK
jgi:hypothetical protein